MKKVIGALLLLPLLFFGLLLLVLDNPGLYRDQLASTVKAETGFALQINGDISWRYWPPIAIQASDVDLRPAGADRALLSFASAAVDLKLLPLIFGGELAIAGLSIDGLTLNAIVAADGKGNWEVPSATKENAATETQTQDNTIKLDIASVKVSNASITYFVPKNVDPKNVDPKNAADYRVTIKSFSTGALRYDTPVTLAFDLTLEDQTARVSAAVNGGGQLTFNSSFDRFQLQNLVINSLVKIPDLGEINTGLNLTGQADLQAGTASLQGSSWQLADLRGSVDLAITDLMGARNLQGKFQLEPVALQALLASLHQPAIETSRADALSSFSASADISGTMPELKLTNLQARLDNSTLTGSLGINLGAATGTKPGVRFDLAMDQVHVSDYLPPVVAATESATAAPLPVDSEVLPVALLHQYDLDGKFTLGQLSYDTYEFSQLVLAVKNANEQLAVDLSTQGYDGRIALKFAARMPVGGTPSATSTLQVTGLDITKLTEFEWITGAVDLQSETRFRGQMLSAILASISGNNVFTIRHGTLDVTPIKTVAATVDSLRGKSSGVAEWPDKMPFQALNGNLRLTDGIQANQQLNLQLETMNIAGGGGIDYWQNQLVYDIGITLQENAASQFSVGPPLAGLRWPLHCAGAMDASPVTLCLPDSKGVSRMVTDLLQQEIKRQGREKLREKLGEQLPADVEEKAKSLLKGLFGK